MPMEELFEDYMDWRLMTRQIRLEQLLVRRSAAEVQQCWFC